MTNENVTGNILATCCALVLMVMVEPVKAFNGVSLFKGGNGACKSMQCWVDCVKKHRLLIGVVVAVLLVIVGLAAASFVLKASKSKKRVSTRKSRK